VQINISTRHGRISTETQEKVREKVAKLSRLYERMTAVEVTVDLGHAEKPEIELRVSIELADDLISTDSGENFWGALDGATHKMEQQLRRHKEKIKGHRTPGHRHQDVSDLTEEPEAEEVE